MCGGGGWGGWTQGTGQQQYKQWQRWCIQQQEHQGQEALQEEQQEQLTSRVAAVVEGSAAGSVSCQQLKSFCSWAAAGHVGSPQQMSFCMCWGWGMLIGLMLLPASHLSALCVCVCALMCVCCVRRSVACGHEHTVCITTKDVFAWGSNEYGQLGHGDAAPDVCSRPFPIKVLHDVMVTQVRVRGLV